MKKYTSICFILTMILVMSSMGQAQTISNQRTFIPAWNAAGYPGEIPNKTGVNVKNFGAAGDGISNDTNAILQAIQWVSSHNEADMVYFPAGTYKITGTLSLPSGVVLRGERNSSGNLVTLKFDLNGGSGDCISISGSASSSLQSFQPQAIHQSWIEVTNSTAFCPGDYAEIMQDNDPAWDNGDTWAKCAVGQIVKIVSISGNILFLEQELRADYLAQFNPKIRKINPKKNVGIDNLKLERVDKGTYGSTIQFRYAAECWVRGVESNKCVQRHININNSTKIEVTGCYFHHAHTYDGGGHGYGVECSMHTGECLIENNIFVYLRHAMLLQAGANGNVYGYNFSTDTYRDEWPHDYASDIAFHGNRSFGNLFEGNIVWNIIWDTSHGEPAGPYNTVFRNSASRYGLLMMGSCKNQNVVGNDVLGEGLGFYTLMGSGHLEHGNRQKKFGGSGYNVVPSNTGNLPDISYYLTTNPLQNIKPRFWTLNNALPTIGCNATVNFGSKINPAKARYDNAQAPKTVGTNDPVNLLPGY